MVRFRRGAGIPTTSVAIGLVLAVLGGCGTSTPAVDVPATVLLPADYAIYPPDPGVPPSVGAFLGVWDGHWDGGGVAAHKLVVHHVTAAGAMRGVYAAAAEAGAAASAPVPVGGRIDGRRLTLTDVPTGVALAYELQPDGTLHVVSDGGNASGSLRRLPDA